MCSAAENIFTPFMSVQIMTVACSHVKKRDVHIRVNKSDLEGKQQVQRATVKCQLSKELNFEVINSAVRTHSEVDFLIFSLISLLLSFIHFLVFLSISFHHSYLTWQFSLFRLHYFSFLVFLNFYLKIFQQSMT